MALSDLYTEITRLYGTCTNRNDLSIDDLEYISGILDEKTLDFLAKCGTGVYKQGYYRIPRHVNFKKILEKIFDGDAYYRAEDLVVVGYTAFNRLDLLNRKGQQLFVFFEKSELSQENDFTPGGVNDVKSVNFQAGRFLLNELSIGTPKFYLDACQKLGTLGEDEVFGYVPALQIGGEWGLDGIQKLKALEHMDFLLDLSPLTLVGMKDTKSESTFDRPRPLRLIGRTR